MQLSTCTKMPRKVKVNMVFLRPSNPNSKPLYSISNDQGDAVGKPFPPQSLLMYMKPMSRNSCLLWTGSIRKGEKHVSWDRVRCFGLYNFINQLYNCIKAEYRVDYRYTIDID